MDVVLAVLFAIGLLLVAFGLIARKTKVSSASTEPLPETYRSLLNKDVPFYQKLNEVQRQEFENRVMHFLATTRITGVNINVEDSDRLYVAASAIIPIFGFKDWEYNNLDEVLLYPDSFNHDFEQTGEGRSILGMVGDGAMQRMMVLSLHDLRQGFWNKTSKENTAIHEFVHLIDKTDGSTDGIPEFFVQHGYIKPWLRLIHKEIQKIKNDRSDINPYGATNEAEFFAVVSEYFFERPDLLQQKHPELFAMLEQAFHQQLEKNKFK